MTPASHQHHQRRTQLTTPASHQHHQRRSTLTKTPSGSISTAQCTVCCIPCLRSRNPGGAERKVHRKDMPTTIPFVVDADQQSPSLRPDVTDTESDSDDELCVLTLQNPARAAVAVPVVPPVVQQPPVPLPRHSRRLAEKKIIQQ